MILRKQKLEISNCGTLAFNFASFSYYISAGCLTMSTNPMSILTWRLPLR